MARQSTRDRLLVRIAVLSERRPVLAILTGLGGVIAFLMLHAALTVVGEIVTDEWIGSHPSVASVVRRCVTWPLDNPLVLILGVPLFCIASVFVLAYLQDHVAASSLGAGTDPLDELVSKAPSSSGNPPSAVVEDRITPKWLTYELGEERRGYRLNELTTTAPHCMDELAKRGIVTREAALGLFDDLRTRELVQWLYAAELPLTRRIDNLRDAYGFCTWGSRIHVVLRDDPERLSEELDTIAKEISISRPDEEKTDLIAKDRVEAEEILGRCIEGSRRAFFTLLEDETSPKLLRRAADSVRSLDQWLHNNGSKLLPQDLVTLIRKEFLVQLYFCIGRHEQFARNENRHESWREAKETFGKLWNDGGIYDRVIEALRPPDLRQGGGDATAGSPPHRSLPPASDAELRRLLRLVARYLSDQKDLTREWNEWSRRHYSDVLSYVRSALDEIRKLRLEESEDNLWGGLLALEAATAKRIRLCGDEEGLRRDHGVNAGAAILTQQRIARAAETWIQMYLETGEGRE